MALSKILRSVKHPHKTPRRKIGAGDVAAAIAQPIAKVLDATVGTSLVDCKTCGQRKEDWNGAIPDVAAFPGVMLDKAKEVLKGLVK